MYVMKPITYEISLLVSTSILQNLPYQLLQVDGALCRRAARCTPRKPLAPAELDACLDRQRAAIVAMARQGKRS